MIIVLSIFALQNCLQMHQSVHICTLKNENFVIPRTDYHDISWSLLLLMITDYSKSYTILIIVEDNIMVNWQNWLIAHPYPTCPHTLIHNASLLY